MAEHAQLATSLGLDVYFCDPRSPWQRGSNENSNRLLHQYLSKGADMSTFSLHDLDDIAARINQRPGASWTGHPPPSCSRLPVPGAHRKGMIPQRAPT